MAKNTGEERRIFLFKNFGKYIKVNYKNKPTSLVDLNLGEEAPKGAGWNKFIEMYFNNENGVLDFFKDIKEIYGKFNSQNQTILQSLVPKVNLQQDDPTNMFVYYACDLDWAQNIGYCTGKPNIDNIVGEYSTDSSVVKDLEIYKSKDPNDITKDTYYLISADLLQVPMLSEYTTSKLIPTNNSSVYSLSSTKSDKELKNVITFDNTGFTFQFLTFTIKATKITQTKPVDTTKKDVTPKKDDTVVKKDKDNEIPVVRTKPLYFDTYKDTTPTKDCGDFPFTLGCVNTKIGDLNAKLFNGDRDNDKYTKSLQNFLDNTANFGSDNPNMELTKDLWNQIMNKNIIKESIKKVLKEYINKKK